MSQAKNRELPENIPLAVFRDLYAPRLHDALDTFIEQFEARLQSLEDPRARFHWLGLLESALKKLPARDTLIDLLNPVVPVRVTFRGPYSLPADALADMRRQAGYSKIRLSQLTGLDRTTVVKAEGDRYRLGHTAYHKLMSAYEISPTDRQLFDNLFFPKRTVST